VDWCGGSETMDEILARIHQREDAAVKRERTMAYAFSHQVCHSHYFGSQDLIGMNTNYMICSGGPTLVRDMVIMNLVKLIGVGAGWNVGLLLARGKAVSLLSLLAQRKHRVHSLARLVEM
jgi:hypothetical protein